MDIKLREQSGGSRCRTLQGMPLGRVYRIVAFAMSTATVHSGDGPRARPFGWALGFRPDGETEVLGLWDRPDAADEVARDLRERGLERVALVIDAGWPSAAGAALRAYGRARAVPSTEHFIRSATALLSPARRKALSAELRAAFGGSEAELRSAVLALDGLVPPGPGEPLRSRLIEAQLLRESLAELAEQEGQLVRVADRTVTGLLDGLARAVRKNGYFLNQDDALECVANALLGAERRMDRERATVAVRVPTVRAVCGDCLAGSSAV